jgi:methyl-accepting chemotaxis protein
MTLKGKFKLMVAVAAAGLLALAGMWLNSERSVLFAERMQKTKSLVDIPYSLISEQYSLEATSKLSRAEAQKHALDAIRVLRYEGRNGTNYFWINDMHPTMVMHPMKPELDGKDLTDYKDPTGKAIFVEMVSAAKNPAGGFVYYMWPKPGQDKPMQKLSFVKGFEPWGWIVGTGVYIDDIDATWRANCAVAGCLGFACLVVLLLTSRHVSRSIFVRLQDMVGRMKDIAEGEGDLTKRLHLHSNDEVAELARWFNVLMDRLHQTLCQVANSTQSLVTAGEEMSSSSREQAEGAEAQKDQTAQVATAMQEMAATVQQVSENSNSAAVASQKAAETAREGGKVVEETLSRMRAIADSVGDTAKKVQELGKRSDQIGQIVGVINDIADQTNLLALNAAIEAARAGEQGRGFAVVADEVRKLAERTSTATKEIADMIRSIQAETKSAVEAMQAGTQQVEMGVESTSQAGQSLQGIIQMTEQVGEMIAHIATASTEQSSATEEVSGNIGKITKIANASAAAAQQISAALEDLSGLAQNLQQLVGQFKLNSAEQGSNGQGRSQASPTQNKSSASVDFARVKMAHRNWRFKLRAFLDGREHLDPKKLASHRDCELGKWIYAEAMPVYGELLDVQQLEEKHKGMHALVKQVVELQHAGKTEEAEQEFTRVTQAAEHVVALLNNVERQVRSAKAAAAAR